MRVIGITWFICWLLGSTAAMTWVTSNAPIWLPMAFAACLAIGFGGAAVIAAFGPRGFNHD